MTRYRRQREREYSVKTMDPEIEGRLTVKERSALAQRLERDHVRMRSIETGKWLRLDGTWAEVE